MGSVALTPRSWIAASRPLLYGAVAAGIAFALWAESLRLAAGWPLGWVIPDLLPGLAFLLCGMVATLRRPDSRIGPVMILTGVAWYAGTAAASKDPVIDRIGYAFQGWYTGLLAWLVLAYPTGRVNSRPGRITLVLLFAALAGATVFRLAAFQWSPDYDFTIPGEADRYIAATTIRDTGEAVSRAVTAVLVAVVLLLVLRRLATETSTSRRIAWPMLVAGIVLTAGFVAQVIAVALASTPTDRFGAWWLADLVTIAGGLAVALSFLVGLARGRLARQNVADLVLELDRTDARPDLRDVIARALRDPSLALLYPHGAGEFIDAEGGRHCLPAAEGGDRAVTRVVSNGVTLAVLVHDPAIREQPELLQSVLAAVRLALENERLAAEVREQLAEVQASRARIVAAGDEQRRRIERDLHDGAQQRLVTLALRLQVARAAMPPGNDELDEALAAAGRDLDAAIVELRDLARGLHPSALASDGLGAAVEALADRTPLEVAADVVDERFDPAVEATAYFVIAEALTNVVRSARATRADITIRASNGALLVRVADDGIGGADPARGSGLRGLEDRVAAIGGRLVINSPVGAGTTIIAELPCA